MSGEVERGNELVPVQYHQFVIRDEDGPVSSCLEQEQNGLVHVSDGWTKNFPPCRSTVPATTGCGSTHAAGTRPSTWLPTR
jgi:hypothetical protein